jgi:hypothetical protein
MMIRYAQFALPTHVSLKNTVSWPVFLQARVCFDTEEMLLLAVSCRAQLAVTVLTIKHAGESVVWCRKQVRDGSSR